MTGGEVIMFILGACIFGFVGFLGGYVGRCSDAEIRLSRHVRQTDVDEHAESYGEYKKTLKENNK